MRKKYLIRLILWAALAVVLYLALAQMGVLYRGPRLALRGPSTNYHSFTCNFPPVYTTSGYDVVTRLEVFRVFDPFKKTHSFRWSNREVFVSWLRDLMELEISSGRGILINFGVGEVIQRADEYLRTAPEASRFSVPQEILTLEKENEFVKVKVYFDDISAESVEGKFTIAHFKSDVFIQFKKL